VFRGRVTAVAFSSDGKTFLTGSGDFGGQNGEVRLWDASAMTPIGDPLLHHGRVAALAFSPDDKIIASGSRDRTARLWNAATGKPIGLPLLHGGEVNAVVFSRDGKTVATASDDKTVRLWNATTGLPLGTPMRHQGSVNSVVFTLDGSTLITGSDDKTIRFWRVPVLLSGVVEQVRAWAELTSGMTLSPEGATSLLEASAWNSMHEKLASGGHQLPDFGNPFMAAPGQGLTYDLHQALSCLESADWQAALWHLDREIRTQPEAWLAYVLRTKARVQLARLDQAAADFAKAFELGPPDQVLLWYGNYADESTNEEQWQTAAWYQDRLVAARPKDAALYLDRVRAYLKRKRWKEEVKDYDEAVKLKPNDPQVWREKASFDISHGRWQEAAKALAKVLELDPNEHYEWYQSAALHLQIGDMDGYRRHCREILRRFGQTDDPMIAERTAKVCMLLPDAVDDQKLVQQLAQRAIAGTEKHGFYHYFQLAKGIAEYRAGHFEQSMEWLPGSQKPRVVRAENSIQATFINASTKALAHLFMAMAQHRLGQADEARETLAKATWLIDAQVRKWKPDDANMGDLDWFMAMIVRKEAEKLIEEKKNP
jgi:tetratricopeptide (TPR) repeat protein